MTTPHEQSEYDRLKTELRRLKRKGAPWYFESALHQRLHGGRGHIRRATLFEPLPVALISLVAFCTIALAAYVLLINSNLFSGDGGSAGRSNVLTVDSLTQESSRTAEVPAATPAGATRNSMQQPKPSPSLKATEIAPAQTVHAREGKNAERLLPVDTNASGATRTVGAGRQAMSQAQDSKPDTTVARRGTGTTPTGKDSLRIPGDSVRGALPEPQVK